MMALVLSLIQFLALKAPTSFILMRLIPLMVLPVRPHLLNPVLRLFLQPLSLTRALLIRLRVILIRAVVTLAVAIRAVVTLAVVTLVVVIQPLILLQVMVLNLVSLALARVILSRLVWLAINLRFARVTPFSARYLPSKRHSAALMLSLKTMQLRRVP